MSKVLFLFYQFKTAGHCVKTDAILQLAVVAYTSSGRELFKFESKLRNSGPIDEEVTKLTGLTLNDLKNAPKGEEVFNKLFQKVVDFMWDQKPSRIIWFADNGKSFDEQLMIRLLHKYSSDECLEADENCQILFRRKKGSKDSLHYVQDCRDMFSRCRLANEVFFHGMANDTLKTVFDFLNDDARSSAEALSVSRKRKATRSSDVMGIQWQDALGGANALRFVCMHNVMQPFLLDNIRSWESVWNQCMKDGEANSQCIYNSPLLNAMYKWTPQQVEIMTASIDLNMSIVAGAGCAKTVTVIGRILYLLHQGVSPSTINLVTFTRSSALDMKKRLLEAAGCDSVDIFIGTLDTFIGRSLKKFVFYDETNCDDLDVTAFSENRDKLKNLLMQSSIEQKKITSEVKYLFVDEAQDLNNEFVPIIKKFHDNGTVITFVGDDAQNIYSFTMSSSHHLTAFSSKFSPSTSHQLTTNFRSTPRLIHLANECLRHQSCIEKTIVAGKPTGPLDSEDSQFSIFVAKSVDEECEKVVALVKRLHDHYKIPLHEIAILARHNKVLHSFETCLVQHDIQCHLNIKDNVHAVDHQVVLSTIHKSKGLEYEAIVYVNVIHSDSDNEEERRIFYTAITRAKTHLFFTFNTQQKANKISRFITELPVDLFKMSMSDRVVPSAAMNEYWSSCNMYNLPMKKSTPSAPNEENTSELIFRPHKISYVDSCMFPKTIVSIQQTLMSFNTTDKLMSSHAIHETLQTFALLEAFTLHASSNESMLTGWTIDKLTELDNALFFFLVRMFNHSGSALCAEQQFSPILLDNFKISKDCQKNIAVRAYHRIVYRQNNVEWSSGSCLVHLLSSDKIDHVDNTVNILDPFMNTFHSLRLPVGKTSDASQNSNAKINSFLRRSETAYLSYQSDDVPRPQMTHEELHSRCEQCAQLSKLVLFREGRKKVAYESPVLADEFYKLLERLARKAADMLPQHLFGQPSVTCPCMTEMHMLLPSTCSSMCYGVDINVYCPSSQIVLVIDPIVGDSVVDKRILENGDLKIKKTALLHFLVQAYALTLAKFHVERIVVYSPRFGYTVTITLTGIDLSAMWDDLCRVIENKPVTKETSSSSSVMCIA